MASENNRQIVIEVGESTFYPKLLGRTGCSMFQVVGSRPGGMLGWHCVRGTAAQRDEWQAAGELFNRSVREAEDVYHAAVRQRSRYLPGARRREERAAERFRDAFAAAEARYAPVRAEITRRLALTKQEVRRDQEELKRRGAEEEAERKEHERMKLARSARCHAMATRTVWGWLLVGQDGTTALVHRHDVHPAQPLPTASRGSSHALNAYTLASELERLGQEEGLTSVRWEKAAREKVVSECSTPQDPVQFGQWWTAVTTGRWRSPDELPQPSSPSDRPQPSSPPSGPAQGRGYSGGDYGGSGGGFSCGFGGGY